MFRHGWVWGCCMGYKEIIKNVLKKRRIVPGPDYRDFGAILLFIFLVPYIVSFFFGNTGQRKNGGGQGTEAGTAMTETEMFQEDLKKTEFIVYNKTAVGTEMIPLETYLVSRLPVTIDMGYEMEALKAQAVVLRTELMKQAEAEGKCIYVESGVVNTEAEEYERSKEAVSSTKGMFLVYENEIITAPYFTVSAGATRNGNEVFGSDEYNYLKSVMCERDFTSEHYAGSVRMSRHTFWNRLGEFMENMEYEEAGGVDRLMLERDRAGYVTEVSVKGDTISGEVFRDAFGLNSSCFEIEEEGDMVIIRTKGTGHGLGLCQYGANEAAKKGSDYIDILNYFFSDTVIEKIGESK